jgi:uncharacterized DUF497 family protein
MDDGLIFIWDENKNRENLKNTGLILIRIISARKANRNERETYNG